MQIICRGSKLWQLSACSVMAFHKYTQVFISGLFQDGESDEPSLAEIHQEMCELLDKQGNAQKESLIKNFRGFGSKKTKQKTSDY